MADCNGHEYHQHYSYIKAPFYKKTGCYLFNPLNLTHLD